MANLKNTLSNMTVVETIILIKEKKISPVEVVKSFLDEIDSKNPEINAFCTVVHDEALREAKRYEEEIIKNGDVGPLYGLPVAIKDLTLTKGIRTTFGSKVFENFIPDRDSIVVERIKKAGGIILGKTNTPEFGHKGTTDNMIFGATKNPHDPGLTTGGSSGGSAAAVAGGMIPFAEGSDGGGSIRIPASLCGVFGLKPTYGRIPNDTDEKNLFATQNPFIHHGPISKTVEDGALLFEIMKGPHPVDPFSLPFISENILAEMKKDVKDLRIAYSPNLGLYEIDAAIKHEISNAAKKIENLGCRVEEVDIDFGLSLEEILRSFAILWFSFMSNNYGHLLDDHEEKLSKAIVKMIKISEGYSLKDYKAVEFTRTKLWTTIQEVFETYDLIICPTLAALPFACNLNGPKEINGKKINPNTDWMLTQIFNLTGHPAASLPVSMVQGNKPVGMQIIGRRFEESKIFRLSHAFEQNFYAN